MANHGYPGFQQPNVGGQDFNSLSFVISQALSGLSTVKVCQVKAVHGDGIATPLTVDLQPMVTQIDGTGNSHPHGTLYGVPVFVLQGGLSAIVIVPMVGDIGATLFCDRDISTVKQTGKVSLPGSRRQMDWADGLYLGGYLNAAPTQYIQMNGGSIHMESPDVSTSGNLRAGTGASGSFTAASGETVTVQDGIITNIY